MNHRVFAGAAASTGLGLGVLYRTDRPVDSPDADVPAATAGTGEPEERIAGALGTVASRLQSLSEKLRGQGRDAEADIMAATSIIAGDPDLLDLAVQNAKDGIPLTAAVQRAADHYADMLAGLDDPTLADRAADVRQIGRAAVREVIGARSLASDASLVLAARELSAAELLELGDRVVGATSVLGGPNSHAAIVARSVGIPFVLGVDHALLDTVDGVAVLVDGDRANVVVSPTPEERRSARAALTAAAARQAAFAAERDAPCRTVDGHPVTLRANVATAYDADAAVHAGADGVGLLRTELPFLDAPECPTQRQHANELRPIFSRLAGRHVTVRTLDFADDKLPPFLSGGAVDVRIGRWLPRMIAQPESFAEQFRAILLQGADIHLQIMIPMVASVAELAECRRILRATAKELGVAVPPLGAMIENRDAVDCADDLAMAADFFSIGTNDLTGQLLGLDRSDPNLTPALAAHPEVLAAVDQVVVGAHRHGRTVSVCGDAAAHPLVTPLLVGLGCDALSVAPAMVDEVRWRVRRLHHQTCRVLARDALTCDTATAVLRLVEHARLPQAP